MSIAPWRDAAGRLSALKATTFAALLPPGLWMAGAALSGGFGRTLWASLVYYTGVWALWALLASLAVTPLARALRWPRLVLVRRMLGVGALVYTLLHVAAYIGLRKFDGLAMAAEILRRGSLLLALAATLVMCAMGATSTDGAVRRLGAQRWKRLQRCIYLAAPVALLHFLLSPLAVGPLPFTLAGLLGWLLAWRVMARRCGTPSAGATAVLTLSAAAATCAFELAWLATYQALPPLEIARANFDIELGLSATWTVLLAGAAIAGLCAWRAAPPAGRRLAQGG